jgi:glycosyltransferase involved in cell wall biosynthesis
MKTHIEFPKYSLSMSVYKNDNLEFFKLAVESATIKQSYPPAEVVLVVDGPIPSTIDVFIGELQSMLPMPMTVIRLAENVGHARARQTGLEATQYPIVALMDSDDLCVTDRFAKQIEAFVMNPSISLIGGQIDEFMDSVDNVVAKRIVPQTDIDIKAYMKARCPMNQMTVIFKRDEVLAVGGYQDWYCDEDYYLWLRLMLNGATFANLPDKLVNVRVGKEMYGRRGSWRYFKSEAKLQRYMLNHKIISLPRYLYNVTVRFVVQVCMPNSVRGWVFQHFARS